MCGEDVVGLASEHEVERRAHGFARGLHDPVEGQEGAHDQLSHLSSFSGFDRHACQYTVRPGAVASYERWSGGWSIGTLARVALLSWVIQAPTGERLSSPTRADP